MSESTKLNAKWEEVILTILRKYYPDIVPLQTIYSEIPDELLSGYAREFREDTNEPHYHHWIRARLGILKNKKKVGHPIRGYWVYLV